MDNRVVTNWTPDQWRKLVEKAKALKRSLIVPEDGVKQNVVYGLNGRLIAGLVKVEFPSIKGTEIDKLADELAWLTQSEIVYRSGEFAVYYRRNPEMSFDELFK